MLATVSTGQVRRAPRTTRQATVREAHAAGTEGPVVCSLHLARGQCIIIMLSVCVCVCVCMCVCVCVALPLSPRFPTSNYGYTAYVRTVSLWYGGRVGDWMGVVLGYFDPGWNSLI